MNINDLTIGQAKQLVQALYTESDGSSLWKIGEKYFIRTVTFYYIGRLEAVTDKELLLSDVAWIPETERLADTLKTGVLREVEPMPGRVLIGRGSVIDATVWIFDLPRKQI